ncbi:hypothetical protein KBZ14_15235 [Synechococcus sp. HJ21-Hayes]|uniref:hypothetical protein n=1 Tax=unclassified Synechococcus TaxID=2626047 RepID=UPI0020CCD4B0|nr:MULTISPECIES: hypothetical protein [unclassified Synechococcus]MCP9832582.1 hypothetical protein [Synechococcus sp. JJ3a-Johnson]MCP9854212.1 hypothetical protein [Synechococcus sp. HJ21-Hayes]
MQFFCIRNEAIRQTHRALQTLREQRQGSLRPGRVLRVAQLYGYLQWRSRGNRDVRVTLRDLGAAWFVQPRLLKSDLDDLQALGWLRFCSDAKGTTVTLASGGLDSDTDEPDREELAMPEPLPAMESVAEIPTVAEEQASSVVHPRVINKAPTEPSAEPEPRPAMNQLISQFTATYNQHKPQSWPAYKPTGTALASRLQRAIRHAGGTEAFWTALIRALRSMPEFWRLTYPQGRSGSDCAMALLSADRKAAGLGVEFWHVFVWGSKGQTAGSSGSYTQRLSSGIGGNTAEVGQDRQAAINHPDFLRARKLLVWGDHAWRCQGMEAFDLPASEKQRLAELLEAAGLGEPGHAAEQFAQEARR